MNWKQDASKLNNVEIIKLEKDGLDVIHDIQRYAELGFAAIEAADFDRLKWYGLYVQRPKSDGLFMLRVKLPGGGLTAEQARTVAAIAQDYTSDRLAITTRQSLQFHGLKVEVLPDIFSRLKAVGLSVVEAAGDCPRNIVGSPLAGIDKNEVLDTRPLIAKMNQYFEGNREFSNLPRKFKIAITGSTDNAIHAQINDLAFVPAVKEINGQAETGFHVLVGGGLSAKPALAVKLDLFVRQEQVLPVAIATASLFRDFGYRESRHHARLKYLIQDWGKEKFTAELLALTGPLLGKGEEPAARSAEGIYYGIHEQKQPGLSYVGLAIEAGQLTAEELTELAGLAEKYGDGTLRTVNSQNLVIANVPNDKLQQLTAEKLIARLAGPENTPLPATVSCTGTEFCPLGLVRTKHLVSPIEAYIKQKGLAGLPVSIHISGCINSCGQQQIADIGLQGVLSRQGDNVNEAFEFWLGGSLTGEGELGTKLKGAVPSERVPQVLGGLLDYFQTAKQPAETFRDFVRRLGIVQLQQVLNHINEMAD